VVPFWQVTEAQAGLLEAFLVAPGASVEPADGGHHRVRVWDVPLYTIVLLEP
jgi:hypothetical protein